MILICPAFFWKKPWDSYVEHVARGLMIELQWRHASLLLHKPPYLIIIIFSCKNVPIRFFTSHSRRVRRFREIFKNPMIVFS